MKAVTKTVRELKGIKAVTKTVKATKAMDAAMETKKTNKAMEAFTKAKKAIKPMKAINKRKVSDKTWWCDICDKSKLSRLPGCPAKAKHWFMLCKNCKTEAELIIF